MSDTHGNYPQALKACQQAEPFDLVIHLGDGGDDVDVLSHCLDREVIHVAGNCDHGSKAPRELIRECAGKRLLLLHGDQYRVKRGLQDLERHASALGVDAVLFGHTHCAAVVPLSGMLFVNPGTLIKTGSANTFAILEIGPSGIDASLHEIDPSL
ncbi:phosphoesterase [Geobacter sp. SVR]|nr:phosphoesterase [Geobacter sp. SVR]